MHNIKRFIGKKIAMAMVLTALASTALLGCSSSNKDTSNATASPTVTGESTTTTETDYSNTPKGSELSVEFKEKDTNTNWKEESYEDITLNGTSITYEGTNATVSGSTITITSAGVYHISGTLSDGQIIVDAANTDFVWLVLDNADITNASGAAIYAKQSDKVTITLADGSTNTVTDGATYSYESETEAPTACIFSKDDISINGQGSLNVTSNSADGISTTNDLKIVSGTITITAADDGIRGKDSVAVKDGVITITASGDGIKSTNTKEDENGYIYIENGTFTITAANDGIQAEKSLCIKDGSFTITTNEGSANAAKKVEEGFGGRGGFGQQQETATPEATATTETETAASTSYKAIKAGNDLYVAGGTFTIDSCDDALHSNNTVTIDNGAFTINTGDDGMHADALLTINNGTITVASSYEGLESKDIVINDGTIHVTAIDDGINAGGGTDSSQSDSPFGGDPFASTGDCSITFNGGTITVTSDGDGIDANGSITQTGGTIYVNGPTNGGNGSLDYDTSYLISGGSLIAVGSSGMAQTTSSDSTQTSIYVNYSNTMDEGSEIKLCDASGNTVLSYTAAKTYDCVILSSSDIKQGETYTLYNGSSKLCTITPDSSATCVTDSGEATTISEMGGGGGRGGNMNGDRGEMKGGDGQGKFQNGTPGEAPSGAPDGQAPSGTPPTGDAPANDSSANQS